MKVSENKNFVAVGASEYNISMAELISLPETMHMSMERKERLNKVLAYIHENDKVEQIFWCDKGHKDGAELHCVTSSGLIFILNERKYLNNIPCLITILLGRPNQVNRLYETINLKAPAEVIDWCVYYQWYGLNNI